MTGMALAALFGASPVRASDPAPFAPIIPDEPSGAIAPIGASNLLGTYDQPVLRLQGRSDALIPLVTRPDVSTVISFEGSERITFVTAGQPDAFIVEVGGNGRTLAVRPETAQARSNLAVVTNRGTYHFDLAAVSSHGGARPVYGVIVEGLHTEGPGRAGAAEGPLAAVDALNFAYTYRGDDALRPVRLFDDGERTYFAFPDLIDLPAIFEVEPDGTESLVNFHREGRYLVVHGLARQYTIRRGSVATCIFNKGFPTPAFGPDAPALEGEGGHA